MCAGGTVLSAKPRRSNRPSYFELLSAALSVVVPLFALVSRGLMHVVVVLLSHIYIGMWHVYYIVQCMCRGMWCVGVLVHAWVWPRRVCRL